MLILAKDLPNSLPRCFLDDPKIGSCIVSAANSLRPRFEEGINEIGIPSYEPLTVSRFVMVQESSLMNFTSEVTNLKIRGMKNFDITEIQYDPKTIAFKGKFELDSVAVDGINNTTGRFLFIPIEGHGRFQVDFGGINATFEITGHMLKHKEIDYYRPKDIKIRLTMNEMQANFHNLFDGDKELGDVTNQMINRNSKLILDAGTPAIEKLCEKLILIYFKWLTKEYPFYVLFPRSETKSKEI